jgi:hypothetical protein
LTYNRKKQGQRKAWYIPSPKYLTQWPWPLTYDCPVIENFIWIEPLLRGHLCYKATFLCSKGDLLIQLWLYILMLIYYPLANEVAKGDSNATIRSSLKNKGNAKHGISPRLNIWPSDLDLWPMTLKIITYLYFKKWYECPISYISTVEWPI